MIPSFLFTVTQILRFLFRFFLSKILTIFGIKMITINAAKYLDIYIFLRVHYISILEEN